MVPQVIFATEGIGLSLSPSYTQLLIQPGKEAPLTLELTNQADPASFAFHLYTVDQSGQFKIQTPIEPGQTDASSIYFTFEDKSLGFNRSFFLTSNKKKTTAVTIAVGEKTPLKDYYYAIVASTEPSGTVSDGSLMVRFKASAASLIFISVSRNGAIIADPRASSFQLHGSSYGPLTLAGKQIVFFDSLDRIQPEIVLKNEGKNFAGASGQIVVKNILGQTSTTVLNSVVLISQGKNTMTLANDKNFKALFPGPYTAYANINVYNPHTKQSIKKITASYQFFVIPAQLLGLFLLLGSAVSFFLHRSRRHPSSSISTTTSPSSSVRA